MEHSNDFHDYLNLGQRGEIIMSHHFRNTLNEKHPEWDHQLTGIGNDKDWDARFLRYPIIQGKGGIHYDEGWSLTIEVKTDYFPKKTGNMFIEKKSRGKKSGLDTTKSDYYIYFFIRKNLYPNDNVYMIKTKDLKELVKKYSHTLTYGGDNNSSLGYLIPIQEVKSFFRTSTYLGYDIPGEGKKTTKKDIMTKCIFSDLEDKKN